MVKATHQTGPFGEALPNQTTPNNTAEGTSYNYLGQHQKLTDTDTSPISGGIIQMGARVYIPTLGRFLSVDPIEGGTDNGYVYANDPVNEEDLDGRILPFVALALGRVALQAAAPHIARAAASYAAKRAVPQVNKSTAPQLGKKIVAASRKIVPNVRAGAGKVMQNFKKGTDYIKSIRFNVQRHPAHHYWKSPVTRQKLWYKHINVMIYRKGVPNSQKRIQIPYGKGCVRRNCR